MNDEAPTPSPEAEAAERLRLLTRDVEALAAAGHPTVSTAALLKLLKGEPATALVPGVALQREVDADRGAWSAIADAYRSGAIG